MAAWKGRAYNEISSFFDFGVVKNTCVQSQQFETFIFKTLLKTQAATGSFGYLVGHRAGVRASQTRQA